MVGCNAILWFKKKKSMLYSSFNNSYYLGREEEEEEFGFCLQFHISHNLACISNFCVLVCVWGGGAYFLFTRCIKLNHMKLPIFNCLGQLL